MFFTDFSIELGAWSIPQTAGVLSYWGEGVVLGAGIIMLLMAVLVVLGGIFALQRKLWGWALAGSIAAILSLYFTISFMLPVMGIIALIFVGLSRKEFE